MAVTVNDVILGVTRALNQQFPDIPVFEETAEPAEQQAYFQVKLSPVEQNRRMDRRYQRIHSFTIRFVPNAGMNLHHTAEQMLDCLASIEVNESSCYGQKLKYEIVDSKVQFTAQYELYITRPKAELPHMQRMQQEGSIKYE